MALKSIALFSFLFFLGGVSIVAQDLDNEAGFIYLKAKYLYETDRYEDAIREFNNVIKKVEDYEDALVLRAESKYALAAYKGAELDALDYIKMKGITPDVSIILGKSQYALKNFEAAKNTLITAVQLNPNNSDPLELLAEMAQEDGESLTACEYWRTAAKLGSSKAKANARKNCGEVVEAEINSQSDDKDEVISVRTKIEGDPMEEMDVDAEIDDDEEASLEEEEGPISIGNRIDDESTAPVNSDTMVVKPSEVQIKVEDVKVVSKPKSNNNTDTDKAEKVEIKVVEIKKEEEIDDTPNNIEIDEDLTLQISGQGLGRREILKTPNILILSEEDGKVVIDVCVNSQGRVESAEFNAKLSTIGKRSLISLAIRKSKEFWFEKDRNKKEQCGIILFDIKGS